MDKRSSLEMDLSASDSQSQCPRLEHQGMMERSRRQALIPLLKDRMVTTLLSDSVKLSIAAVATIIATATATVIAIITIPPLLMEHHRELHHLQSQSCTNSKLILS